MDLAKSFAPTRTRNGIKFQTTSIPVLVPCPFPREMNQEYAFREAKSEVELDDFKNQFIQEIATESSGFFSREAILHFRFSDNKEIIIKPVGTPYLDIAIHYQKIGLTYQPKTYADVSGKYPNTFERCSLKGIAETAALKTLVVNSFNIYSTHKSESAYASMAQPVCAVKIDGTLSFDRLSQFAYDHDEQVCVQIYPDRIYQCIEKGPSERTKSYHLELE